MIPVSLTAFTGYFLHFPVLNNEIVFVTLGVLFQGAAASALNQLQEKSIDLSMDRTKSRPFPSGNMSITQAIIFITLTLATGSFLIYHFGNTLAMILGLFTIAWYNGIYTYLKRITPFAILPGAVTGAIPPVIGWTAAGGYPLEKIPLLLAFVFFMGQVPHFWLLIMKYGDQYEKAGLPSLKRLFQSDQIRRLTFIWTTASVISASLLGFFGIIQSVIFRLILLFITLLVITIFLDLLSYKKGVKTKSIHFIALNTYFLLLMIILISDKIISL